MNSIFALVLLVAVAGIAECKPKASQQKENLKARVLAKVADFKAKRGEEEVDWPYGWMEYASLIGKCEIAMNWLELIEMDMRSVGDDENDTCILSEACPKAFQVGEDLLDADDAEMEKATAFMREIFGLLQCVNLQAEREELQLVLGLNNKDESEAAFLREAKPLFSVCEDVFKSVEEQEEEFEKKLQQFKDGSKRGANIQSLLRELLKVNRS